MRGQEADYVSTQSLRGFIELLANLPGNFEVQVRSHKDTEGVLQCGNKIIRNAACMDLSGVRALAEILSWPQIAFRIEDLKLPPPQEIYIPLEYLLQAMVPKSPAPIFG